MLYNLTDNDVIKFLAIKGLPHYISKNHIYKYSFHSLANVMFTKLPILVLHLAVLLSHYGFISLKESFKNHFMYVTAVFFSEPAVHIVYPCFNSIVSFNLVTCRNSLCKLVLCDMN